MIAAPSRVQKSQIHKRQLSTLASLNQTTTTTTTMSTHTATQGSNQASGRASGHRGRRGRGGPRGGAGRGGRGGGGKASHIAQEIAATTKDKPEENATNGAAGTDAKPDDAATADGDVVCFICAEPVKYYAVSVCNHRTCHVCSLRLRALYKKLDCTFCKVCYAIGSLDVAFMLGVGATTVCGFHVFAGCTVVLLYP